MRTRKIENRPQERSASGLNNPLDGPGRKKHGRVDSTGDLSLRCQMKLNWKFGINWINNLDK